MDMSERPTVDGVLDSLLDCLWSQPYGDEHVIVHMEKGSHLEIIIKCNDSDLVLNVLRTRFGVVDMKVYELKDIIRRYAAILPLLLLSYQASAQEDQGPIERLENCFHRQSFDSLLDQNSPDEFRKRALQSCRKEMVYVDYAYPDRKSVV